MKKVLIIANPFLPFEEGGSVNRVLKFIKYLPSFGWSPIILTVKNDNINSPFAIGSFERVKSRCPVYRAFCFNIFSGLKYRYAKNNTDKENRVSKIAPSAHREKRFLGKWSRLLHSWMLLPDTALEWLPFAALKGVEIFKKQRIDAIFSSSPYSTNHLIALILRKIFRKPWVADFRDLWFIPHLRYPGGLHKLLNGMLERLVVKNADKIIVVSEPMKKKILRKFPFISKEKISVIYNGFDSDDFRGLTRKEYKEFTITHSGTFYWTKTLKVFLNAVKSLLKENVKIKNKIRIIFVGNFNTITSKVIQEVGLAGFIKVIPFVSQRKSIQYILNSDVLLLMPFPRPENITGKLFEYLKAKRPILTLANDGACKSLVESKKAGIVVDPNSIEAIKDTLLRFYKSYTANDLNVSIDDSEIEKFSRKNLTKELAQELDRVCKVA